MSSLYPSDWRSYLTILVIGFRLMGLFVLVPALSHTAIPMRVKLLFALSVSLALFPVVGPMVAVPDADLGGIAWVALRESLIGLMMGFSAYLVFEGIHLAAQFIGYQMGFGSVALLDPVTQSHSSVVVPLVSWLGLVVFFLLDIHHVVLAAFVESYRITSQVSLTQSALQDSFAMLVRMGGELFLTAVGMALPATALVLMINVAACVISRLIPQMPVFLFAFPITMFLGLGFLYLFAPQLLAGIEELLSDTGTKMVSVLKTI